MRKLSVAKCEEEFIFYGWVILFAAFCITIILGGVHYSFGVLFKSLLTEFNWMRWVTASVFSIYMVVMSVSKIFLGKLTDIYGPRVIICCGGLLVGSGLALITLTSTIWQLYLFYGFITAIGMATLYVPPASTVATWFTKKRGLALGVASSGIGIGWLIMIYLANFLIYSLGWRLSYVILGSTSMIVILTAGAFMKRNPNESGIKVSSKSMKVGKTKIKTNAGDLDIRQVIKMRSFWMLYVTYALAFAGHEIVAVHLVAYVMDIGLSETVAAVALGLIGGGSVIGRIVIGAFSDLAGRVRALISSLFIHAIVAPWLMIIRGEWILLVYAPLFGLLYGGWQTLIAATTGDFFGSRHMGGILGIMDTAVGLGGAIGPAVVGYLFDIMGNYNIAFLLCSVFFLTASASALFAVIPKRTVIKE